MNALFRRPTPMPPPVIRSTSRTHVGRVRRVNEDRLLDALVGPAASPATRDSFRRKLRALTGGRDADIVFENGVYTACAPCSVTTSREPRGPATSTASSPRNEPGRTALPTDIRIGGQFQIGDSSLSRGKSRNPGTVY